MTTKFFVTLGSRAVRYLGTGRVSVGYLGGDILLTFRLDREARAAVTRLRAYIEQHEIVASAQAVDAAITAALA